MRILGTFAVLLIVMWIVFTAAAHLTAAEALDAPWPSSLGSVRNDVVRRYPPHATTDAGRQLIEMAAGAGVQLAEKGEEVSAAPDDDELMTTAGDFVYMQLVKADDAVDAPPARIETLVYQKQEWLDAIARFVNASAPKIAWHEDISQRAWPVPSSNGHILLARLLGASALMKVRRGEAAAAWDDVHAIVLLSRTLLRRADTLSVSTAVSNLRLANGVARKLPPPLPAWWREVEELDVRRAVAAAHQVETYAYWQWLMQGRKAYPIRAAIWSGYNDAVLTSFLNRRRGAAEELLASTACVFRADEFERRWKAPRWSYFPRPEFARSFQRAPVFDYELAATEHAMAIKEHRPASPSSRCTDGTWIYANHLLHFSTRVPLDPPGRPAVPETMAY